jgi:hypothetical protein
VIFDPAAVILVICLKQFRNKGTAIGTSTERVFSAPVLPARGGFAVDTPRTLRLPFEYPPASFPPGIPGVFC